MPSPPKSFHKGNNTSEGIFHRNDRTSVKCKSAPPKSERFETETKSHLNQEISPKATNQAKVFSPRTIGQAAEVTAKTENRSLDGIAKVKTSAKTAEPTPVL